MAPAKLTPNVVCETCGTPFHVRPHVIALGKGKYCSKACAYHRNGGGMKMCERCGKQFHVPANAFATARFCSRECQFPPVELTCKTCGKTFRVPPDRRDTARYCSTECYRPNVEDQIARFWSHVQIGAPDECWDWQAFTHDDGYGNTRWEGKNIPAHRLAYILTYGALSDELFACHTCDNRRCCNPVHLFPGTHEENMSDRDAKGRQARGETQGHSRLTDADVQEIRQLYGTMPQTQIARRFNVSPQCVHAVVHRRSWKHVA